MTKTPVRLTRREALERLKGTMEETKKKCRCPGLGPREDPAPKQKRLTGEAGIDRPELGVQYA